jgi:prepilin-type N-terminal cleavage/methylation domain-containing protein
MDMAKTSRLKKLTSQQAFTLLEVMIVLGILGALLAFGMPKMRSPQNNIKAVVRKIATLTREIRHQARVKHMTYRLALRMSGGAQKNGPPDAYWVENASGNILVPSEQTVESMAKLKNDEKPPEPFRKVESLVKGERELPSGLFIGSVETANSDKAVSDGMGYVYFTPEGLVEKAMIQITNRDRLTWTIIINPLTGHVDVVEKAMNLKDLQID